MLLVSGRLELLGLNYSKCITGFHGKSVFVRVTATFGLSGVDCKYKKKCNAFTYHSAVTTLHKRFFGYCWARAGAKTANFTAYSC